jgi:hypothetical protein
MDKPEPLIYKPELDRFVRKSDGKVYRCVEDILYCFSPKLKENYLDSTKTKLNDKKKKAMEKFFNPGIVKIISANKRAEKEYVPFFNLKENMVYLQPVVQNDELEIADLFYFVKITKTNSSYCIYVDYDCGDLSFYFEDNKFKSILSEIDYNRTTFHAFRLSIMIYLASLYNNIYDPAWCYLVNKSVVGRDKSKPIRRNEEIYVDYYKNISKLILEEYKQTFL